MCLGKFSSLFSNGWLYIYSNIVHTNGCQQPPETQSTLSTLTSLLRQAWIHHWCYPLMHTEPQHIFPHAVSSRSCHAMLNRWQGCHLQAHHLYQDHDSSGNRTLHGRMHGRLSTAQGSMGDSWLKWWLCMHHLCGFTQEWWWGAMSE